jgi:hypothetical protein
MKVKLIILLAIITFTTSCVTNRITNIPNMSTISNFEKDRIEILGKAEGSCGGGRVWVLFIPIGWAADNWLEGKAYKNALKNYPNADGLIDQIQTYHKTSVPLFVITPQVKLVKVTGTAYHIRNDAELQEYLKTKNNN